MATEKYFVFSESGELKRMKGRIVRFLDNEDPTGSDKSAIRTSLEVSPDAAGLVQADVGTAPNEIPVNGMLGDMAYQSSDGVSMGTATVDNDLTVGNATTGGQVQVIGGAASAPSFAFSNDPDTGMSRPTSNAVNFVTGGTERVRIDSSGRVGIGDTSPDHKLTIDSGDIQLQANKATNVPVQSINWKNTNSTGFDIARIQANTGANIYEGELRFITKDSGGTMATRWSISPSGNLVANGTAIDFGSGASTTLDAYEEGSWTPVIGPNSGSFSGGNTYVFFAKYTKIGNLVTANCYINTTSINTTGGTGAVVISGLPFNVPSASNYVSVNVGFAYNWVNNPAGGYISSGTNKIILTTRKSIVTGYLTAGDVADLSTSASACNEIMLSVTYQTT